MKITSFLPWFGAASCALAMQVSANTIYLVRHAEKQDDSKDPALSECGQKRAQALAALFADIPLAAVYATPYQRTQQTAAAVANNKKLPWAGTIKLQGSVITDVFFQYSTVMID